MKIAREAKFDELALLISGTKSKPEAEASFVHWPNQIEGPGIRKTEPLQRIKYVLKYIL